MNGRKQARRKFISYLVYVQIRYAKPIISGKILQNKHLLRKLEAIQKLCSLIMISAYCIFSSTLVGILPIELLLQAQLYIINGKEERTAAKEIYNIVCTLKIATRKSMLMEWQERWRNDPKGGETYIRIPNVE